MLVFFGNLIFWVERVVERFWEGTRQPPGKSPQLPLDPAAPLRGVGAGWGVAEVGVEEEEEEEEERERRRRGWGGASRENHSAAVAASGWD